jgi:hypothetical protein
MPNTCSTPIISSERTMACAPVICSDAARGLGGVGTAAFAVLAGEGAGVVLGAID